jgi:hypothetical protein
MGDSIYPSGSLEPVGVMADGWSSPTVYRPVLIPVGALVEVAPMAGAMWGGRVGVVIDRLASVGSRGVLCRVAGEVGTVDLPEYALRLLSLPPVG